MFRAVSSHLPHHHFLKQYKHKHQKQQCDQCSRSRSRRSSCCPVGRFKQRIVLLFRSRHPHFDHDAGSYDIDCCIDDLLQNLGDRSRNHSSHSLKISAHYTEHCHDKQRRSQHLECIDTKRRFHQMSGDHICPQKDCQCHNCPHGNRKHHCTFKNSKGVSWLVHRHLCGDQLGYRDWKTEGGQHQCHRINLICISEKSVSLISDNIGQRNPVQCPDDLYNHCRRCKDCSLYQKFILFRLFFSSFVLLYICHPSPPSRP